MLQARVRHLAEPVAFSNGAQAERQLVEKHFERLCEHRLVSLKQEGGFSHEVHRREEFTYNFLTEFFLLYDNLPIWKHG